MVWPSADCIDQAAKLVLRVPMGEGSVQLLGVAVAVSPATTKSTMQASLPTTKLWSTCTCPGVAAGSITTFPVGAVVVGAEPSLHVSVSVPPT
jgi:hypothetical protein